MALTDEFTSKALKSIKNCSPKENLPMLVPAAQYVRMSTEHQQYSFDSQKAAIAVYAGHHGFAVVKTYDDAARSGVVLKGRSGLKRLLRDVLSGTASYKAILVYDISRWGRFQDADEAAHYEFLCKHAGIPVHYCAEPFGNDDNLANMMMKALKRTMAGEYSRELSVKCYEGQKRVAQLGFITGSSPTYAFRRVVVSQDGKRKQVLRPGEHK
ncbi:MAG TPA: recombinase family protein, partial [Terriglobales bacterium]|nr:recombinase family protein [Terriglobales bacterium]